LGKRVDWAPVNGLENFLLNIKYFIHVCINLFLIKDNFLSWENLQQQQYALNIMFFKMDFFIIFATCFGVSMVENLN